MDSENFWEQYKKDWAASRSPAMEPATFTSLFYDSEMSHEAVELIRSSSYAYRTLDRVTRSHPSEIIGRLSDPDVFRVWVAVRGEDAMDDLMISERNEIGRVADRVSLVEDLAKAAVDHFGRASIRNRIQRWWQEADFLEEEKEALLKTLARRNVLTWWSLEALGVDAVEITQRMVRRGEMWAERIEGIDATSLSIQSSRPGDRWAKRIGELLHPVTIPLDIRDSCLTPGELTLLNGKVSVASNSTILRRAVRRLRHPDRDEILYALRELSDQFLLPAQNGTETPHLRFPLIRFLHLRLLLETPSLSSALNSPEQFLIPEVLTYTLGNDHVSYVPELRVFRALERRWRARWAESAGEAISVMFLESTVDLDLTTVARIPETSDQTPDFLARTVDDEPIVFEAKGATAWNVHLKQRRRALRQLLKRRSKSGEITWAGSGRAFALSLFAARQGDEKCSLFHVDDPAFPFHYLFHEGWEEQARRSHFSAVLEAARLYETADNIRLRQFTEITQERPETFKIGGPNDREPNFVGTFLPVLETARRLRHPDMKQVEKLRIFVGVREEILTDLRKNKLPRRLGRGAERTDEEALTSVPAWGFLPGLEVNLPPRGVYSSLADGSFMAVERQ